MHASALHSGLCALGPITVITLELQYQPHADLRTDDFSSLASHTLRAKEKKEEGSGDCAYNVSFHSPSIDGGPYFVCTAYEAGYSKHVAELAVN